MIFQKKYFVPVLVIILLAVVLLFLFYNKTNNNQQLLLNKSSSAASDTAKSGATNEIVDEMPKLISMSAPKYPPKGKDEKLECTVYVRILIDINGNPVKTEIMKREGGSKEFEDSSIVAVMRSKFIPAKLKGNPVDAWVVMPFRFKLQ